MFDGSRRKEECQESAGYPADVYSFEWFLRQYVGSRFPAALKRHVSVSDIVQSIFCLVVPKMHQYRGSSEIEFRGWLMRIAERKILDSLRRYRQRECPSGLRGQFITDGREPLEERTPGTQIATTEETRLLLNAIAQLPSDIRAIVTLRHLHQKTFGEISAELAMPITTCRRRWIEGLKQLEIELGETLR